LRLINMAGKKNIILGVTAGAAIYKACEIIRRLKESGFNVIPVLTEEAAGLINPLLFSTLSGNKAYYKLFDCGENWEVEHISLADKADIILVAPATANLLGKIASGICDDLLSCVITASKAPVFFCPAMNENMYLNRITQRNIAKLKECGYKFIGPKKGMLACGKKGMGCLEDVEAIVEKVRGCF